MAKIGKPLSFVISGPVPLLIAAPTPTPTPAPAPAPAVTEKIRRILDEQIGNPLSRKAKEPGGNTDQALQSIINENGQSVKDTLSNKYKDTPEVLRTAINKKLDRLQDPSNSSAHTDLSKSVYINFLNEFLGELTPKEQPRQTGTALARRLVLPDINKPN
jgi:hypothetical protein